MSQGSDRRKKRGREREREEEEEEEEEREICSSVMSTLHTDSIFTDSYALSGT